ncbi:MAG: acetylglutamate kinase [Planctomycetes bacterium]|nr:acetylglutamate kinase [Planctomycetota bacterium]MCB9825752.1 acetylglutamate kinase [Planctomycetota bacterium]MCB9829999.1 acetylglutamate kinase [Planctomycetota bacterium]
MRDVRLLREALPYLRRYRRQTIVVKMGGEIAAQPEALRSLAEDISLLTHVNIRIVVIHGGGPQATQMAERLGLEARMVQGRRVTDEETLKIAKMIFAGSINVDILSALRAAGVSSVGLSGVDGDILQARQRPPTEVRDVTTGETTLVDYGFVGDVTEVDVDLLHLLVNHGYVPVMSSLAGDDEGRVLNVNADTVAGAIAAKMGANKLISLTNVPGILRDPKDPSTLLPRATADEVQAMIEDGTISGGMVPKVTTLLRAVREGVEQAVIMSGLQESALLLELFTDQGSGTLIDKDGTST